MKQLVGLSYLLDYGGVNGVLLDDGGELTLVDAGFPGKADIVWRALDELGRRKSHLRHLILTHAHPDHIGSAAAIIQQTGAKTYISTADASIAERGGPFRPMTPAPGLLNRIGFKLAIRPDQTVEPVKIDNLIEDGDLLPIAGGLEVVATPGHCAGQIALLWQGDRLLIGGDVCTNICRLGDPIGFEDEQLGRESQRKVSSLRYDVAAFGYGRPLKSRASQRMARKWLKA